MNVKHCSEYLKNKEKTALKKKFTIKDHTITWSYDSWISDVSIIESVEILN